MTIDHVIVYAAIGSFLLIIVSGIIGLIWAAL